MASGVSLSWASASPWPLKFWAAALTPDPHPKTPAPLPSPQEGPQEVPASSRAVWCPQLGGGCLPVCTFSPCGFQGVLSSGGVRGGDEEGSTALPRSNSVADEGNEKFCLMSVSSH